MRGQSEIHDKKAVSIISIDQNVGTCISTYTRIYVAGRILQTYFFNHFAPNKPLNEQTLNESIK